MLTKRDQEFVQRDQKLPGLSLLLDTERLTPVLQKNFSDEIIVDVVPNYIRYKPGTNCLVAYQVKTERRLLDVYARAYADNDPESREKTRKSNNKPGEGMAFCRQAVLVLNELSVVFYFYPFDKKLHRLAKFEDMAWRDRLLEKMFPGKAGPENLWKCTRIRYKPERRYVTRLDLNNSPYAVLKWYTPEAYKRAKKAAKLYSGGKVLQVPKLLAWHNYHHVLAFEWLESTVLSELISSNNSGLSTVGATGKALAELHSKPFKGVESLESARSADDILQAVAGNMAIYPGLSDQLSAIGNEIAHCLNELESVCLPVHGDFYSDQVLVLNDGSISLIDFDRTVLGDPAQDLGNFIAHTERQVIVQEISRHEAGKIVGALIEGYKPAGDVLARINLYAAAALFKLLQEAFRHRKPDQDIEAGKILDAATELLERHKLAPVRLPQAVKSGSLAVKHSAEVTALLNDESMPWIYQALDRRFMAKKLNTTIRQFYNNDSGVIPEGSDFSIRVDDARLIRHKPGRRCLLEYTITLYVDDEKNHTLTVMGKVRARGLDEKTYRHNLELWNHGFGSSCDDGLMIPRPVGLLPELNMWLYQRVEGVPAGEILKRGCNGSLPERIASAIYKLHESGVIPQKVHQLDDELKILKERMSMLASGFPQLSTRVDQVMSACYDLAQRIPDSTLRCIHRDFYFDQLIVDEKNDHIYLIDLDLLCLGDPALDLGNFIAHLMEAGLGTKGDVNAFNNTCDVLKHRYLELSGTSNQKAVDAYVTLSMVRLIQISTLFPDRQAFTEQLLGICEQRLGISASQTEKLAG